MRFIDIPGFCDKSSKEGLCVALVQSWRISVEARWYRKAYDIIIGEYMILELIYQEPLTLRSF